MFDDDEFEAMFVAGMQIISEKSRKIHNCTRCGRPLLAKVKP